MKNLLIILFFFISVTNTSAHQPKLIKYSPTLNEPHNVIEPEISKAYYGKLNGKPHYYKIKSNTDFSFYAGITIPKKMIILNGFQLRFIIKIIN